jgi:ATP synthase protein I
VLSRAGLEPWRENGFVVRDEYKGLGAYGTVGIQLVLSILLGFWAGRWLDQKFSTHGWLTVIGFGFGVAAGFRSLYEAAKKMREEAEAEDERERRRRHGEPENHDGPDSN